MSKHTPGPWIVLGNSVGGPAIYTADRSKAIAEVRTSGGVHVGGPQHPTTEANARLMAASPDLLEVCKSVIDFLSGPTPLTDGEEEELLNQAIAAISKATGSQP